MIYRIITPNPDFTGDRAGIQVVAGHGVTSDPIAAEECRNMGYAVVEAPELALSAPRTAPTQLLPIDSSPSDSSPSDSLTPDSLTSAAEPAPETRKARRKGA